MLPHLNSWQDDNDNDALSDEEDGEDMQFQDGGTDEDEGAGGDGAEDEGLSDEYEGVCVCKFCLLKRKGMQFQDGGTDEDEGAFAGGRKMRALAMSMKVCVCKFGFNNEYERL